MFSSLQCIFETEYGFREANVFNIMKYLENFLIYLIFEFWAVKCSLTLTKSKQRKLAHKSLEGIFVGYASDCPAWLIYNQNTWSITRAGSDVFNEQ